MDEPLLLGCDPCLQIPVLDSTIGTGIHEPKGSEMSLGVVNTEEKADATAFISTLPDTDYTLLQPIPVRLERGEEGEWIACFDEANISMSGTEPEEARQALADDILDAFALFLTEEETLGPEPAQQLAVLRRYLQTC